MASKKRKIPWSNKKYGKQPYWGSYERSKGSRYLVLTGAVTGRRFEVESHESAKKLGWKHG